ncbi:hypothetical protein BJX68DRAFT_223643 [Aspergillus pseudodeflectus]|uniref:Uncharacterized protein n=1 Tax=Aspergillus pseudodeflectus TaxID=176178 RepID=A0ABR4LBV4_9EURO
MTNSSTTTTTRPNDFGSDLWVRKGTVEKRHPTAGRGLFAGLQDQKHYHVDSGWAKRDYEAPGLFATLFNRIFGGSYRPPQ